MRRRRAGSSRPSSHPSEADIVLWCEVCRAPGRAIDLMVASRAADSAYVEWRRLNRTGMRHLQENKRPLYERTTSFKVYVSTLVPGLMQTPGYARALLSSIIAFRETPNYVEDAVAARVSRNHVLGSPGKRFAILIEEAVLPYGVGDSETMLAQLGHLMTVTPLSNVRLGIIPTSVLERPMWTVESFNVFDDNLARLRGKRCLPGRCFGSSSDATLSSSTGYRRQL